MSSRDSLDEELDTLWECANEMATDDWGGDHTRWLAEKDNCIKEAKQAIHQWALDEVRKAEQVHEENYVWLLGLGDDFPQSEPGKRYNWRSKLREKIPKQMLYKINSRLKGDIDELPR